MKNNVSEVLLYNPHSNTDVTFLYTQIICDVFSEMGLIINKIDNIKKYEKNYKNIIIVIDLKDVILAQKCGYKNIIYWVQGVASEEIYFKKKDILRYILYSYREFIALNASYFIFFCSENMKKHYEKKYRFNTQNCYIMPCFNEEIHPGLILNKNYCNNSFVYAGSLEKWQNFEETVKYYKKIEKRVKNTIFKVYVRETEKAKEILERYNVYNYVIDFVTPQALSKEISQSKFGFCLRKNITVNLVATPTKLSNYISNGVFPIYSECLESFYSQAKKSKYCFNVDAPDTLNRIIELCKLSPDNNDILNDYNRHFGDYYSVSYHKKNIKDLFSKLFIK